MLDEQVVEIARSWIGTPYHVGALVKGKGVDCLGLVIATGCELFEAPMLKMPRYPGRWSAVQAGQEMMLDAANQYLEQVDIDTRGPGVVLAFRLHPKAVAQHCGIMTTDKKMVHAHSGRATYEVTVGQKWGSRVAAAFKYTESKEEQWRR